MSGQQLVLDFEDGVATIALDRPDKLNAVGRELADQLEAAIVEVARRRVRCAVLRGRGRAFCVGADLAGGGGDPAAADAWISRIAALLQALQRLPCPLVSFVHGYALGFGASLAIAADLVLATEDAKFGFPEVRHGLVPGVTMALLAERVDIASACEMLLMGERFDAAQAERYGLVNCVVSSADGETALAAWVQRLLEGSPTAMRTTKRLMREMMALTPKSRMAAGVDAVLAGRQTADAKEGFAAFREKRKPVWAD